MPETVGVQCTEGGGGTDGMGLMSKACFCFFWSGPCPVWCISAVDAAETGPSEGVPGRGKQDDRGLFTSNVFVFFVFHGKLRLDMPETLSHILPIFRFLIFNPRSEWIRLA